MVGSERPQFVLFGSSIVQFGFRNDGWAAILSGLYSRKADIILRGYAGWNSRRAVHVLEQVFSKDAAGQPSLIITYFGGNDSMRPFASGGGPHVPLLEYVENMRKIVTYLKSLSEKTRLIFLSTPPVNEAKVREIFMSNRMVPLIRTNENCHKYSDACLQLWQEMDVKAIDLWTAMQGRDDWANACFTDGIHLSSEGSKIVAKEILNVLKEADWEPSLHWKSLPTEFADVLPYGPGDTTSGTSPRTQPSGIWIVIDTIHRNFSYSFVPNCLILSQL